MTYWYMGQHGLTSKTCWRERSQAQESIYYKISCMWSSGTGKTNQTKIRVVTVFEGGGLATKRHEETSSNGENILCLDISICLSKLIKDVYLTIFAFYSEFYLKSAVKKIF